MEKKHAILAQEISEALARGLEDRVESELTSLMNGLDEVMVACRAGKKTVMDRMHAIHRERFTAHARISTTTVLNPQE